MKIELFAEIGNIGIILDPERIISDIIDVEVGYVSPGGDRGASQGGDRDDSQDGSQDDSQVDGVLTVGQRNFRITDGIGHIREREIMFGSNTVSFRLSDGTLFNCGMLSRSGRYLSALNDTDAVLSSLARAYCMQSRELDLIHSELRSLKERFGISIV